MAFLERVEADKVQIQTTWQEFETKYQRSLVVFGIHLAVMCGDINIFSKKWNQPHVAAAAKANSRCFEKPSCAADMNFKMQSTLFLPRSLPHAATVFLLV